MVLAKYPRRLDIMWINEGPNAWTGPPDFGPSHFVLRTSFLTKMCECFTKNVLLSPPAPPFDRYLPAIYGYLY